MKKLILCLILIPSCLLAEEFQFGTDSAFYPSEGSESSEIQIWTGFTYSKPTLTGKSFLTENNRLDVKGTVSFSPVSLSGDLIWQLTPLAFLKLEQGTHLGTGWTLNNSIVGLGLNTEDTSESTDNSLNGLVCKTWLGLTMQFDLAAVLPDPGEYSHVVLQTTFSALYQYYNRADGDKPWRYMADKGENFNGFLGQNKTILGYIIPHSPIDFIGLMLETQKNSGRIGALSKTSENGWGSDFTEIRFGPLGHWQINNHHSLAVLAQWKNYREYTAQTENETYFIDKVCTGDSYLTFERVAISYKYVW